MSLNLGQRAEDVVLSVNLDDRLSHHGPLMLICAVRFKEPDGLVTQCHVRQGIVHECEVGPLRHELLGRFTP